MIPSTFASEKWLARLNVAAVAFTLAACTAALLDHASLASAWIVGLPTVVVGAIWAKLLRRRSTIARSGLRWGWIASIPLAALNAGLACAAMSASGSSDRVEHLLLGFLAGMTLGAFVWLPALLVTLVCFGIPIAWAERLSAKGLAGTERGERIIAVVCVVLGIGALALASTGHSVPLELHDGPFGGPSDAGRITSRLFAGALAVSGVLLAVFAFAVAQLRERRRKHFVTRVEAGEERHFRVEATAEGRVLLRIEAQGRGAYRVADYEEEVCRLDAANEVTHPRRETA